MTDRMTLEQVKDYIQFADGVDAALIGCGYSRETPMNAADVIAQQHAALLEAFAAAGINDPWKLAEQIRAGEWRVVPTEPTAEMFDMIVQESPQTSEPRELWIKTVQAAPTHGGQE